jgi:cytochrome c oxidase subunit 3
MTALVRARHFGLVAFLASTTMLFTAFTASYLVRRTAADWRPIALPSLFWFTTALLVAGSVTIEAARRTGKSVWLQVTRALGAAFVVGQAVAWVQLPHAGPHAAFVWMLAAVHGLHVLGGVVALGLAVPYQLGPVALYWHFVDGVWLFLILLLSTL